MADGTPQNGTDTIATDDLTTLNGGASTGIKVQRMKVGFGSDNTLRDVDTSNPLPVGGGFVSTANSTAVALASGGVFTGTSEDVSQYASITVTVFADTNSITDGLSIQQSSNGTNWDITDVYTIPTNTGKTFAVHVTAKFFRVLYSNGAVAQSVLRLQTMFHSVMGVSSSQRPQDGRSNDNDFQEVLGYNMVFNGTSWDRARGNGGAANVALPPTTLLVTATGAAAGAVTATLPAAGAGLFHYITAIEIAKYASVAVVGAAAPVVVTTTNLPGALAYTTPTAQAVGTQYDIDSKLVTPLKSSAANTATTIVAPATTSVIWRITVAYYTAA